MPKVRRSGTKPPAGWDSVSDRLAACERALRDAESAGHDGKRKAESVWAIFRICHQRSRFVYDAYYSRGAISKDLYEFLLREGHADAALIAKWKKQGYERLCCLRCVQTRDHAFGTTCICRVPRDQLDAGKVVECIHCGCRGCASGDARATALVPGGLDEQQPDDGN